MTKFLFGMCDCTVVSDVGKGDISLVQGDFACVWTRAHAIAQVKRHGLLLHFHLTSVDIKVYLPCSAKQKLLGATTAH